MRIVIALGGNALLRRGDPMTTEVQRQNVKIAAEAITPLAAEHSIVVVHGNGPQVGLPSLQAESYPDAPPYPQDAAKFVGPVYDKADAGKLAAVKGWVFRQDGEAWRRVMPSPGPGRSWKSSRSAGCWTGAPSSSAPAAGTSPRCTRLPTPAPWPAWKRSSTRIWPANCWPRTWPRTCS